MSAATNSAKAQEPQQDAGADPSMEEILASIRRIIADDQALPLTQREETPPAQPARKPVSVETTAQPVTPEPAVDSEREAAPERESKPSAGKPAAASAAVDSSGDFEAWLSETARRARSDEPLVASANLTPASGPAAVREARIEAVTRQAVLDKVEIAAELLDSQQPLADEALAQEPAQQAPGSDDVAPELASHQAVEDLEQDAPLMQEPADPDRSNVLAPQPMAVASQSEHDDWDRLLSKRKEATGADPDEADTDDWGPIGNSTVGPGAEDQTGEFADDDGIYDSATDHLDDELDTPVSNASGERPDLLSGNASSSVSSSFQALTQTVMMQNSGMIEKEIGSLLRPMLKQWLDDNLPTMVERLVRAEIERVARGGPDN